MSRYTDEMDAIEDAAGQARFDAMKRRDETRPGFVGVPPEKQFEIDMAKAQRDAEPLRKAMAETRPVTALSDLIDRLRTQDNRATANPLFIVQQRRRIYGLDPAYSDTHVWIDLCNDHDEADEAKHRELDRADQCGDDYDACWTKTAYIDLWEFVTACFTEAGCERYIEANRHNLTDPRIYAMSLHRNEEMLAVRAALSHLESTLKEKP